MAGHWKYVYVYVVSHHQDLQRTCLGQYRLYVKFFQEPHHFYAHRGRVCITASFDYETSIQTFVYAYNFEVDPNYKCPPDLTQAIQHFVKLVLLPSDVILTTLGSN